MLIEIALVAVKEQPFTIYEYETVISSFAAAVSNPVALIVALSPFVTDHVPPYT